MVTVVSRASHVHHVPQVGFPQIDPETIVMARNSTPTSAEAWATRSTASDRVARYAIDASRRTPKARYSPMMALGTCRYMIRWTLPWMTSRGATTKAITSPATSARDAIHPRTRIIVVLKPRGRMAWPGSALDDELEGEESHHDEDEIGGAEEGEPVRGRGEPLAREHRLGRTHRSQENRHFERQEENREEQLAGAEVSRHGREQRSQSGEADGGERDDGQQRGQDAGQVEVEEDREQNEQERLDDEHQA